MNRLFQASLTFILYNTISYYTIKDGQNQRIPIEEFVSLFSQNVIKLSTEIEFI